jgi:hypothetical protein
MVQSLDSSRLKVAPQGLACDCFGVPQARPSSCCLELPADRVKRPDLAIYSPEEQIAKGAEPTWNSPDIIAMDFPYTRLNDETQVTVRNLSPDIWAVGAQVHLSISPFGIGFEQRPVASQTVSLAPSASAALSFPLSRADVLGDVRIGIHIRIEHPHDPNRINNAGSQVLAAFLTSVSGRRLALDIPVHNLSTFTRRFTLRVLAGDLVAAVEPASRSFAPLETGTVRLRTEVPASIVATPDHRTRRSVTVIATADDGSLVGGVTQLVVIDA